MRKFWLEDQIGTRRSLQEKGTLFLHQPQGLGWADENTYAPAGGFFKRTSREYSQGSIAGELVFGGYADYTDFVDWAICAGLILVYAPAGDEYRADVDIVMLEKGEVKGGALICPVELRLKSPWSRATPIVVPLSPPAAVGSYKKYTYAYDVQYNVSATECTVELSPRGHLPAAVDVECPGPLRNPCITLTDDAGAIIGKCDLDGVTVAASEKLFFSTRFGSVGAWKDAADLIGVIDLANNNFFELPARQASFLSLTSADAVSTTATIKLYEYFRSV